MPGYPLGVTTVEWWLYSPSFQAQYPANHEQKIFMGESKVPTVGTTADGYWTASFTIPSSGKITVDRDGQSPGGLGFSRVYTLTAGTYGVQSHLQNAWWQANMPDPGKTAMVDITVKGAPTGPLPDPTPDPVPTPKPTPKPPVVQPTGPRNLVTAASVEPGVPAGCYTVQRNAGDGAVFVAGVLTNPVHVHTGKRSLGLWWVQGPQHRGDAKYMTGPSACSPKVTPGKQYTASVWTKTIAPSNHLTVYRQLTSGQWVYWTDLRSFGPIARYSKVAGVTPRIPAGTQRIAFGISTTDTGIIVTDDYALYEGAQAVGALPPVKKPIIILPRPGGQPNPPAPQPIVQPQPKPQPAPIPQGTHRAPYFCAAADHNKIEISIDGKKIQCLPVAGGKWQWKLV